MQVNAEQFNAWMKRLAEVLDGMEGTKFDEEKKVDPSVQELFDRIYAAYDLAEKVEGDKRVLTDVRNRLAGALKSASLLKQ